MLAWKILCNARARFTMMHLRLGLTQISPTTAFYFSMESGHVSENDEEQGDFLNFSDEIVQLPTIKQSGTTELDFQGLLALPLKLHEDLKNGCGGQLWPAGMVLANYMLRRQKNSMQGKTMYVQSSL